MIGGLTKILQQGKQDVASALAQQKGAQTADSEHREWHIPFAHRRLLRSANRNGSIRNLPLAVVFFNDCIPAAQIKPVASLILGIRPLIPKLGTSGHRTHFTIRCRVPWYDQPQESGLTSVL